MKCIGMALLSFVLTVLFFSCVKEQGRDECSSGYSIVVGIRDKNFSNINTITGLKPRSEQLAFRQYVSNLSYRLEGQESGETVMEMDHQEVNDNEQFVKIDLPELVSGNYRLSLFGNVREHLELRTGQLVYQLHSNDQEGEDVYVITDTLDFSSGPVEEQLFLQRAKGYLFIQMEGIPDSIGRIVQEVSHVCGEVNQRLEYGRDVTVVKAFTENLHSSAVLQTFLAPTVDGEESVLRLSFYGQGAMVPFMYLPDILLTIKRNQVAAYKINYKPEGGIEVWVSVNGAWMKQHDMDVQLIIKNK